MKVVLDTNVLLIALPRTSPYRPIFENILNGIYKLVISNEILSEYEEILSKQTTPEIANNVVNLLVSLPNVIFQEVYFKWNFITQDVDDNKFVDCAIAGNAKYIVTEDKHFNNLDTEDLFGLEVLNADDFIVKL